MKRSVALSWAVVAIAALVVPGCAGGPSEEEIRLAELETQLEQIRQAYDQLQQTRTDIAAAEAEMAELQDIAAARRSEEQQQRLAELETRLPELEAARDTAFEQVQTQLADFLNVALNEMPDADITRQALEIYSAESILIASDTVAKAGDYKKAINQLSTAQSYYAATPFEPYPELVATVERFEELRFINQERFDQIAKGMTADEVRETAGVPYYGNIRTDEEQGVEMWLYPKREGGAAAVYFRIKTGKVYEKNFDAVKTKVVSD